MASLTDSIDEPVRERIEANASGGILAKLKSQEMGEKSGALVQYSADKPTSKSSVFANANMKSSALVTANLASRWPRPEWKAVSYTESSRDTKDGCVRLLDKSNEWFATVVRRPIEQKFGFSHWWFEVNFDRHIEQVMGLAISDKHPYMFSCGADKKSNVGI